MSRMWLMWLLGFLLLTPINAGELSNSVLTAGELLHTGQFISSPDNKTGSDQFQILTCYVSVIKTAQPKTHAYSCHLITVFLVMENSGALSLCTAISSPGTCKSQTTLWSSNTQGHPGAFARMVNPHTTHWNLCGWCTASTRSTPLRTGSVWCFRSMG